MLLLRDRPIIGGYLKVSEKNGEQNEAKYFSYSFGAFHYASDGK